MPKPVRKRVDSLVPKNDMPPDPIVSKFVTLYVAHRDLQLAAAQVRLAPEMGARLYKNEKVREAIDRKIMLIDAEEAKLRAKANLLSVHRIDAALMDEIKRVDSRKWSLRLGYERTGLIKGGEFYVAPDPNANKNAPSIYQARQTTTMRKVTEEVTTETVVSAPALPKTEEPTAFRIIEY